MCKHLQKGFFAIVFGLLAADGMQAQVVYVPVEHPVVEFLQRLETRGLAPQVESATLPWTRQQIGRWLAALEKAPLSRVEREEWCRYAAEFDNVYTEDDWRLRRAAHKAGRYWRPLRSLYANRVDFLAWREGKAEIHLNPLVVRERSWITADTLTSARAQHQDRNGFAVWGTFANRLGFSVLATDTREWGAPSYTRRMNITAPGLGFVNGFGDHLEHDETEAFLSLALPDGLVGFGKMATVWGPGRWGHLLLSNAAPSFDQFRLQVRAGRFSLVWLYGFLRFYQDPNHHTLPPPKKAITAHRLVFRARHNLTLAFAEAVVFGRRWFVPSYANPIMFYRSAEHFWGDEDNAVMGGDIRWRPVPGLELYGEGLLDDFSVKKAGTGWYGDKWAVLLGARGAWAFLGGDWTATLEYARIRPYVYSHKDSLTSYAHFVTVLGHPAGPNSEVWKAEVVYRPAWRWSVAVGVESRRHGANPPGLNIGGNWQQGHLYGDPERVAFLDGLREWQKRLTLGVNYRLAYQVLVSFRFCWAQGTVKPESEHTVNCRTVRLALALHLPGLPR